MAVLEVKPGRQAIAIGVQLASHAMQKNRLLLFALAAAVLAPGAFGQIDHRITERIRALE